MLNDEAQKILLNTKGIMNDLSEELLDCLLRFESKCDTICTNMMIGVEKMIKFSC